MDTNAPSALDADIALLYLNRRDRALGLPRPGAKTVNLLGYRHKRQQEALDRLAQAAFLKEVIAECRTEAVALVKAGEDTPEIRDKILKLNDLAIQALSSLEALTHA